jgi:hypothetical protein
LAEIKAKQLVPACGRQAAKILKRREEIPEAKRGELRMC